jgi:hypothetical protein
VSESNKGRNFTQLVACSSPSPSFAGMSHMRGFAC